MCTPLIFQLSFLKIILRRYKLFRRRCLHDCIPFYNSTCSCDWFSFNVWFIFKEKLLVKYCIYSKLNYWDDSYRPMSSIGLLCSAGVLLLCCITTHDHHYACCGKYMWTDSLWATRCASFKLPTNIPLTGPSFASQIPGHKVPCRCV